MQNNDFDKIDEIPEVKRSPTFSKRIQGFFGVAVLVLIGTLLFLLDSKTNNPDKDKSKVKHAIARPVDYSKLLAPEPPKQSKVSDGIVEALSPQPNQPAWEDRKMKTGWQGGGGNSEPVKTEQQTVNVLKSPLRLKDTDVDAVSAAVFPDRDYLLTRGKDIDCVLEEAIDSQLPSDVKCIVSAHVMSASGNVILLEQGSTIHGKSQGGSSIVAGQSRLGIVWDRADTQSGVVVNLAGVGTDNLGRAGIVGELDTHFWDRFSSAIAISLIQTAAQGLSNSLISRGNGNTYFGGGFANSGAEQIVESVLQQQANQPNTITISQGQSIKVRITRDLSFKDIYSLRLKP